MFCSWKASNNSLGTIRVKPLLTHIWCIRCVFNPCLPPNIRMRWQLNPCLHCTSRYSHLQIAAHNIATRENYTEFSPQLSCSLVGSPKPTLVYCVKRVLTLRILWLFWLFFFQLYDLQSLFYFDILYHHIGTVILPYLSFYLVYQDKTKSGMEFRASTFDRSSRRCSAWFSFYAESSWNSTSTCVTATVWKGNQWQLEKWAKPSTPLG